MWVVVDEFSKLVKTDCGVLPFTAGEDYQLISKFAHTHKAVSHARQQEAFAVSPRHVKVGSMHKIPTIFVAEAKYTAHYEFLHRIQLQMVRFTILINKYQ